MILESYSGANIIIRHADDCVGGTFVTNSWEGLRMSETFWSGGTLVQYGTASLMMMEIRKHI